MSDETFNIVYLGWKAYLVYQKDCDEPITVELTRQQEQDWDGLCSRLEDEKRKYLKQIFLDN